VRLAERISASLTGRNTSNIVKHQKRKNEMQELNSDRNLKLHTKDKKYKG